MTYSPEQLQRQMLKAQYGSQAADEIMKSLQTVEQLAAAHAARKDNQWKMNTASSAASPQKR